MKMVAILFQKESSKYLLYYVVEDYAGNRDFASLADFAGTEDSGRIKVSVLDADTHKELDTDFVYRIKDDQGQYVNLDKGKKSISLSLVATWQNSLPMTNQI